ncbi:UbiA prenyltransferase family [Daldinia decipiens]|uniref:UbiA prenyltransferase family n=1 Tax=Daldinia decipiens TaxID=326647 RepID=UPI0020C31D8C|nr:UbiA prenyltransferase family [Daldinia decipiens]KAI1658973.1 UbiA prenyltransferase family [Daldinia decipiens]
MAKADSLISALYTLWLFPLSDIPTMIIPVTLLGMLTAASGQFGTLASSRDVLLRLPQTFSWVWLNVFLFSISNQRSKESILEDSINKPWRPLPAGKLDMSQARQLLLIGIPLVLTSCSLCLGAAQETAFCLVLTWMYNDLGGADEHFVLRNMINGVAYFFYGSGALKVATGSESVGSEASVWLLMVACIITTTMQVQDLKDQEGDKARKRSTAPLDLGDRVCRFSIAVGVILWSLACLSYWPWSPIGLLVVLSLGSLVVWRVTLLRNAAEDALTYRWWSIWLISVFCLPIIASH